MPNGQIISCLRIALVALFTTALWFPAGATEKVDFGKLVGDVVQSIMPFLESRKLRLSTSLDEQCFVVGERFTLFQAISNLVSNAIDFSPDGGLLEINVYKREHDHMVECEVLDQGKGIEPQLQGKIMERFVSALRPDSDDRSSGLGLHYVNEIAILHGGSVSVHNQEGGGTRAVIRVKAG